MLIFGAYLDFTDLQANRPNRGCLVKRNESDRQPISVQPSSESGLHCLNRLTYALLPPLLEQPSGNDGNCMPMIGEVINPDVHRRREWTSGMCSPNRYPPICVRKYAIKAITIRGNIRGWCPGKARDGRQPIALELCDGAESEAAMIEQSPWVGCIHDLVSA